MSNWIKRTLRTFIQTAVGYAAVNAVTIDFSAEWSVMKTTLIGLAVSSVASGIAAVMNYNEKE